VSTHEVTNQVPPFTGHNLFTGDAALSEALARWGAVSREDAAEATADLDALGALAGSGVAQAWADQADRVLPVLHTHNAQGERIDEVEFHPAWHQLMDVAVSNGLTAEPWTRPAGSAAHLRRAAGFVVWTQAEAAHLCPISMTYAAAPALRATPEVADRWLAGLASRRYDAGLRRPADKAGLIAGMAMTEKQGGSDVRSNTTVAVKVPGGPIDGETHQLTGHKWFCSAPMSDVFLVLAQAEGGLTCFLVPRVLDDGHRNTFLIQRLKDKVGNRANASSEIELDGTWGMRVGEEGRGVRTIIDMVASTRLDTVLGSTALMRLALARAVHHARHRAAFGRALVDQPLMRNVLADLALESEAATVLAMRLAHAVDEGDTEFSRIGVALGKSWVCKRTPAMVAEAMECLGGAGYVEENGLARLYREAPLNSIWEGSGNVNALDVLRAMVREPGSLAAVGKELALVRGHDAVLDARIDEVEGYAALAAREDAPWQARRIVERLALTLQAALLIQHSPEAVSHAFLASRLRADHGGMFGTLSPDVGAARVAQLIDRALPA
jgi:putative acyl-CoA dehydrogenase